jgi:hypothetical protein
MLLALAVVAIALFAFMIHPALDGLAARDARLVELDRGLQDDRFAIGRLQAYPHLRKRYAAQIGAVDMRSSDAVLIADFLDAVVTTASLRHVAVVSLTSDAGVVPTPPGARFREVPLVLTEDGRYADVLATLDALSRVHEIVRVEGLDLSRLEGTAAVRRGVRAVIGLHLLRFDRDPLAEPSAAPSAPLGGMRHGA